MNTRIVTVDRWLMLGLLLALTVPTGMRAADGVRLRVEDGPAHGYVLADLDLGAALRWCGTTNARPEHLRVRDATTGQDLPAQFVPAPGAADTMDGTLILRLARGTTSAELTVTVADGPAPAATIVGNPGSCTITTRCCRVLHTAGTHGALPGRITFTQTGKVFEAFRWRDRVYHPDSGSWETGNDPQARITAVHSGPLATVVHVRARYLNGKEEAPPSAPAATYSWCYLHDLPLVRVVATATQEPGTPWAEAHVLELNFDDTDFPRWIGGDPPQQGAFTGEAASFHCTPWGALTDGTNAVAVVGGGRVLVYDHTGSSYLQAHGDRAWQAWPDRTRQWATWLWIGSDENPAGALKAAAGSLPTEAHVSFSVASLDAALEAPETRAAAWHIRAAAGQLAAGGRYQAAMDILKGTWPHRLLALDAGELGCILERGDGGLHLLSLYDIRAGRELASEHTVPFFDLTLQHPRTGKKMHVTSDGGWREVRWTEAAKNGRATLTWHTPDAAELDGLSVRIAVTHGQDAEALAWSLQATAPTADWSLWQVDFPRVALREPTPGATLFMPRAAGQLEKRAWRRPVKSGGRYPSGWTTMQYMAAYAGDGSNGLYLGLHDPWGSTKDILAETRVDTRAVILSFAHPVPDMGKPENTFALPGEAVLQPLRGDWFDAARIYRRWVRAHARWSPTLTEAGRADTPLWMRELPVWAMGGGDPRSGLPVLRRFRDAMGLPVGFHWYNWHRIPFDNDYPHYFPADDGFAGAVSNLQEHQIHVMPYINGRLWDTRDHGTNDAQFTSVARPATTKNEALEPYTESYGSREADGSKVELAAMCPATARWQDTVSDLVSTLVNTCGVDGVYIDQVAAAKPRLCFDPTHGHPLGGGCWWTRSYWKLLESTRRTMPDGRVLTTECNADPYIKWFDGYLTWHWQYDGQVPAFPAVYGGAVQMFGRAYRGGPDKNLALRMKAGQQFVYGEQLGWINPTVVGEPENMAFLRQLAHLRWRYRTYFYAGRMGRPPRVEGDIPTVTADWRWHDVWPVTTPAAMSGAWELPQDQRVVILLVNVGDRPIRTAIAGDAGAYGIGGDRVRLAAVTPDGALPAKIVPAHFRRETLLPPRSAQVWEIRREDDSAP